MKSPRFLPTLFTSALLGVTVFAASPEVKTAAPALLPPKPADSYFAKFEPKPAPQPAGLVLQKGDRLAICGDSITEQKMYSRIMETYLTVCVPELDIAVRQYGWGGETAPGFLKRMTNDCLRFEPTVATTCYGMNDHGYRPYEESIGERYKTASDAIVRSFKAAGTRVIQGSPGCVGIKGIDAKTGARPKGWDEAGVEAKNINLCTLRNLGIDISESEKTGFADVFWPMLNAGFKAQNTYSTNYAIAGGDGVHPGWAGHAVMAYAFLHGLGVNGDIGTITMDWKSGQSTASSGHTIVTSKNGSVEVESSRYPFCASGDIKSDKSIRSAMTLIPFNEQLNRLTFRLKAATAKNYKVTWGNQTRSYPGDQLDRGINLAADFEENPFSDAFKGVDEAVAAKQAYETKQIKAIFHDLVNGKWKTAEEIKDPAIKELFALRKDDGTFDRDQIAAATEKARAPLVAAVKKAFKPVKHTIRVEVE